MSRRNPQIQLPLKTTDLLVLEILRQQICEPRLVEDSKAEPVARHPITSVSAVFSTSERACRKGGVRPCPNRSPRSDERCPAHAYPLFATPVDLSTPEINTKCPLLAISWLVASESSMLWEGLCSRADFCDTGIWSREEVKITETELRASNQGGALLQRYTGVIQTMASFDRASPVERAYRGRRWTRSGAWL